MQHHSALPLPFPLHPNIVNRPVSISKSNWILENAASLFIIIFFLEIRSIKLWNGMRIFFAGCFLFDSMTGREHLLLFLNWNWFHSNGNYGGSCRASTQQIQLNLGKFNSTLSEMKWEIKKTEFSREHGLNLIQFKGKLQNFIGIQPVKRNLIKKYIRKERSNQIVSPFPVIFWPI